MREHVLGNNSNAAVLEAALASLTDADLVPRQRKLNNDTRRWLCSELEKDGYRYIPSEANFVMIELNGEVQPMIDAFRQRKILVGRQFPSMKNWLRVSIGKPEEMEVFFAGAAYDYASGGSSSSVAVVTKFDIEHRVWLMVGLLRQRANVVTELEAAIAYC